MYGDNLNNLRTLADQIVDTTKVTPNTVKQDSDIRKGLASRATRQSKNAMQDVADMALGDQQPDPIADTNSMMASYIASINAASTDARTSIMDAQQTMGAIPVDYTADAQGRPLTTGRPMSRSERFPVAPEEIQSVISSAAQRLGVDSNYLNNLAYAESSYDPNAKASSSSAGGLFQFIDDTWLATVRKHGDLAGLDTENMSRNQLLSLKFDPTINSLMGAAYAADNQRELESFLDRDIRPADLYAMHFMGRTGGKNFIANYEAEPDALAIRHVSDRVASANPNIFYRGGDTSKPRTMREVYSLLGYKVGG